MPQKKNYKKKQNKRNYKRKNYRRKKQYSSNLIISKPLLPQTQKVMMRYTTRFVINPAQIQNHSVAGVQAASAMPVSTYTLSWNNLNDIDQSVTAATTATHTDMDGAWNHQPRMYDQYSVFYDKITAIGAKAKMTFLAQDRVLALPTYDEHNNLSGQTTHIADPLPTYVGYLNSSYADNANVNEKFDNLLEKREIVYRKLVDQDRPQTLIAKWSLNKEPSRKSKLQLEASQMSDDWGANFNHDLVSSQFRYLHLFAHPMSTQETRSNHTGFRDPEPIDVCVEMDIICVLSDRKDVDQS